MELQSTMEPNSGLYVTKTTFWWAVGIIILLLAAISFSMSRDISRLSLRTHNTGTVTDTKVNTTTVPTNSTPPINNPLLNGTGSEPEPVHAPVNNQ